MILDHYNNVSLRLIEFRDAIQSGCPCKWFFSALIDFVPIVSSFRSKNVLLRIQSIPQSLSPTCTHTRGLWLLTHPHDFNHA